MVSHQRTRTAKRRREPMAKPYRERLRELRERAGLSVTDVAKSLGYAFPSGYHGFEHAAKQKDRPISDKIVRKLIPILRGQGTPPITLEEIMALSGTEDLGSSAAAAYVKGADEFGLLQLRYRIEPGIYIKAGAAQRGHGSSRIGASPEYRSERQFAARVTETIGRWYPAGSQLHCVDPVEFPASALSGRKVLVAATYGSSDLSEVTVATVERVTSGDPVMQDVEGNLVAGTILGVIVGAYVRQ